jgi:hypothetical protein
MKAGFVKICALIAIGFAVPAAWPNKATCAEFTEHQIKAAFLYNFVQFTVWPKGKPADSNAIIIGLLGEHQFGNSFDPIKNKTVNNKRVVIVEFGKFNRFLKAGDKSETHLTDEAEKLKKCHVLFVCDSEREKFRKIIDAVKNCNVLTVGETEDFLEFGGIITFIPGTSKAVFEVNLNTCEREGLKISSKVLRLARKVISDKGIAPDKDK